MIPVIALQSMFEGLYGRAVHPAGAFKERLRQEGYDATRPSTSYPLAVWTACLDVTVAELYPAIPRAEAWEHIGRRFIDGYLETLVGRMIAITLPFMSPRLFLDRVPRFMTTGLVGAVVLLDWHDAKSATLTIRGVHELSSSLMSGVVASCFERMKVGPVKLATRGLGGLDTALDMTLP